MRRGEWTWPTPLGYINNREKRNIDPDPDKAPIIRKAFELYATGAHTLLSLRNELTRLGLCTRKGKVLPVSNIQKMLRHHVYYGVISMNGELFPGAFEPIVSKRLFDRAQEMMSFKEQTHAEEKTRVSIHQFPALRLLRVRHLRRTPERTSLLPMHTSAVSAISENTFGKRACSKKYARSSKKSLPDEWAENMLREIDKRKAKGAIRPLGICCAS